jgi:hypothetical protein
MFYLYNLSIALCPLWFDSEFGEHFDNKKVTISYYDFLPEGVFKL